MNKKIPLVIGGVLLFSGCCKKLELVPCSDNSCTPYIQNEVKKNNCIIKVEAKGVGVVPCNGTCNTAQAEAMARRAAILDAYKALTEKLYGIKINGRDSVKNMILQNSNIRAYVEGLIRGASVEEENFKNGMYSVRLSVKIDTRKWNKFLKNMPENSTVF
jgi:hypothetical protein